MNHMIHRIGDFTNPERAVLAELLKRRNEGRRDVLSVVLEHSGADYDTLVAETGLSRSTVRYHVAHFDEIGIVNRKGNPAIVDFERPEIAKMVENAIEDVESSDRFRPEGTRRERAQARRERRKHWKRTAP